MRPQVVIVPLFVVVFLFVLWMWGRGMITGAFILLGAFLGTIVGFAVGVALGPGPEAGAMYGIEQAASGVVAGSFGLLTGSVLGGASAWVFKRRREREQHRTPSSLSPGEHTRST